MFDNCYYCSSVSIVLVATSQIRHSLAEQKTTMRIALLLILFFRAVVARHPKNSDESGIQRVLQSCGVGETLYGGECWCGQDYFSATGQAPCQPCDANSVSNQAIGSNKCVCNTNYYSVDGTAPCDYCGEGAYNNGLGNTDASSCRCSQGYAGNNGQAPCSQCPLNSNSFYCQVYYGPTCHFSLDPTSCFYSCSAGWGMSYGSCGNQGPCPTNGVSYCSCSPGYYSLSGDGTGPCEQCPVGSLPAYYFPGSTTPSVVGFGAQTCICAQGYISDTGQVPCTMCPYGTSNSGNGLASCPICDYGFYSATGNTPCNQCSPGTTTAQPGSISDTSCTVCAVGYYSSTGNAPCAMCPAGQTSSRMAAGATACESISPASPGDPTAQPTPAPTGPTYAPTNMPVHTRRPTNSPTLRPTTPGACQQGSYSATGHEPGCGSCAEGTTNNGPGMSACNQCVDGYYGLGGAPPCHPCPQGYTSLAVMSNRAFCFPCYGTGQCAPSPSTSPVSASYAPSKSTPQKRQHPTKRLRYDGSNMHLDVAATLSTDKGRTTKGVSMDI